uniref:Uncharacterized protein n=1 Tax=Anguilla anguilla TaxID=7936 RepID=A0A0E9U1C6_ANGAN
MIRQSTTGIKMSCAVPGTPPYVCPFVSGHRQAPPTCQL